MVEIVVRLRHAVCMVAPEMFMNFSLSVCLELALVTEEGEILVKVPNVGPKVLLPHGLVSAMLTCEPQSFVN